MPLHLKMMEGLFFSMSLDVSTLKKGFEKWLNPPHTNTAEAAKLFIDAYFDYLRGITCTGTVPNLLAIEEFRYIMTKYVTSSFGAMSPAGFAGGMVGAVGQFWSIGGSSVLSGATSVSDMNAKNALNSALMNGLIFGLTNAPISDLAGTFANGYDAYTRNLDVVAGSTEHPA